MDEQAKKSFSFDWRWFVAAYCYLVLFHLLPTYMFGSAMIRPRFPGEFGGFETATNAALMVWILGGVAVVAFIVGLRSREFTVLEPAAAGFLYAMTLALAFRSMVSSFVRDRPTLAVVFWSIIILLLSALSAWIGEAVQARRAQAKQVVK